MRTAALCLGGEEPWGVLAFRSGPGAGGSSDRARRPSQLTPFSRATSQPAALLLRRDLALQLGLDAFALRLRLAQPPRLLILPHAPRPHG